MEQHIEFDRNKLEAALRDGLKLNDCSPNDLNQLLLNADDEIEEELEQSDATLELAALGASYTLGDLELNAVLGNLALLHVIESPLVVELEEGDTISFDQCCEALYVMYHGKKVIGDIMHIQQKIKDMLLVKDVIAKNPELMDKLLDRIEVISKARAEFTHKAREFYLEHFNQAELQDILDKLCGILSDAIISHVPEQGNEKEGKKKD